MFDQLLSYVSDDHQSIYSDDTDAIGWNAIIDLNDRYQDYIDVANILTTVLWDVTQVISQWLYDTWDQWEMEDYLEDLRRVAYGSPETLAIILDSLPD